MLKNIFVLMIVLFSFKQIFSQNQLLRNVIEKQKNQLFEKKNKNSYELEKKFHISLLDVTFSEIMIKNGFLKNEAIKIQFPTEAKKMKDVLIKFDKGNLANELVFKMNRTAERVCKISKEEIIMELTKLDFSNIKFEEKTKLSQLILQNGDVNYVINKNLKSELNKNNSVSLVWNNLVRINNKIPISRLSWTKSNNFSFEKYLEEEIIRGILFSLEQRIKESSIKLNF